jgi:alpha-glucosidase (family GH31 glycosyl hydrolase)
MEPASSSPESGSRSPPGPRQARWRWTSSASARLRALCRLTGLPAQLPEWAYGFWKSRDVHEHQEDVIDDFEGFRRHRIPLDAIVIDSPWATHYNTWEFNPYQFPDAPGMIARLRAGGVRTVVWVTPWVNLDSRNGQIPPQSGSERLHLQPASNYAPAAAAGHFVAEPDGSPFVTQWWMGTGSTVDFTSSEAERWWRESAKRVLELGVEGIKAGRRRGRLLHPRAGAARRRA